MSRPSLHWVFFMSKYFSVWLHIKKKRLYLLVMANNSTGFTKRRWVRKGLTEQVDNAFVISSKEPDGVFEEQHEGCIDDSISQLVGIDLRESNQPRHLSLKLLHSDLLTHKKQKVCFWIREIQQSRCTLHTPDEQLLTTWAAEPRGWGVGGFTLNSHWNREGRPSGSE